MKKLKKFNSKTDFSMNSLFNTPDNQEFLGIRSDASLNKANKKGTPQYEEWLRKYREKRGAKAKLEDAAKEKSAAKEVLDSGSEKARFEKVSNEIKDYLSTIPKKDWDNFVKNGSDSLGRHWSNMKGDFKALNLTLANALKLRGPKKDRYEMLSEESFNKLKDFADKLGLPGVDLNFAHYRDAEDDNDEDYMSVIKYSLDRSKKLAELKPHKEEIEADIEKKKKTAKNIKPEDLKSFLGDKFPDKPLVFKVDGNTVVAQYSPYTGEKSVEVNNRSLLKWEENSQKMSDLPKAIMDDISYQNREAEKREQSKENYLKKVRSYTSFRKLVSDDIKRQQQWQLDYGAGEIEGYDYPEDFDWEKATEVMKKLSDKEIKDGDVQGKVLDKMGYDSSELWNGL